MHQCVGACVHCGSQVISDATFDMESARVVMRACLCTSALVCGVMRFQVILNATFDIKSAHVVTCALCVCVRVCLYISVRVRAFVHCGPR